MFVSECCAEVDHSYGESLSLVCNKWGRTQQRLDVHICSTNTHHSCWEIAAMFDEILTRNHQESLPRNSTNGADIFLKKHFGIRNGGMTTARIGYSRAAAHLNAFLLTLLISHLVRLFCALWTIWSLWEDAMVHKGRCTDSQQTSVFVCFLFCAAYLMKIWWFMQLRK